MRTRCFDAVVNFCPPKEAATLQGSIDFTGEKVSASFHPYGRVAERSNRFFVRVQTSRPLSLKWGDTFRVRARKKLKTLGSGRVLDPRGEEVPIKKTEKRIALLKRLLTREEREMLLVLANENGIRGIMEDEILSFSPLSKKSLLALSQELEEEGEAKILGFSPLLLITQSSMDFLCEQLLALLFRFHSDNPSKRGLSLARIQKRFALPQRILSLAVRYLVQQGKLKESEGMVALAGFKVILSPEEEKILGELEEMCRKGEFQTMSLPDLKRNFGLSTERLNRMISLLIERKKIVRGDEGFILHSDWLEELIRKIRSSGKKELTVADFKAMTGLSRKYAIPLLELLDQRGVTRRRGPTRIIVSRKEIKNHLKKSL